MHQKQSIPTAYDLRQNHPNPFNPSTTIEYDLPKNVEVEITIFNLLGSKIRTLVDESMNAGSHRIVWDAKDNAGRTVSTGVYFYRMKAGDFVKVKKLLFMK